MSIPGIDNNFEIEASWNDRGLARSNDGKSYWTEPYRAKYISTADYSAAQDSALHQAGSESLRISDQARGEFTGLLRASNGTQIELPYRQFDKAAQGSIDSDVRFGFTEQQKIGANSTAEQSLQIPRGKKAPTSGRKTLKLHAPKRPETWEASGLNGAQLDSTKRRNGRAQAKRPAPSGLPELSSSELSQRTNLNLPVRPGKEGDDRQSGTERHDSLAPKSEGSELTESPKFQLNSQATAFPTTTTPVRTMQEEPIQSTEDRSTRASRRRRGNDLTIYGTPTLGSSEGGKLETWYLATDGKNYLYQGDEDPAWIVHKFEVKRGGAPALPSKRNSPGRHGSPYGRRSTSRRRGV